MTEQVGQSSSWSEQFLASHPLEGLPREARTTFEDFLKQRQGILDFYRSFPEERIDEKIGEGNSAKDDIVDLIATTRVRSKAIREGKLESWVDPEKEALRELPIAKLLEMLEGSTDDYYQSIADLRRPFLPVGLEEKALVLIKGGHSHEVLHLGFAIKFGDKFGSPRPDSVKTIFGP